jgi:hypothetical protein
MKHKTPPQYYARNTDALRNGSFLRRTAGGLALFMLGDYLGDVDTVPEGLTEFDQKTANGFLPACCK